jgi:hypothetical protein
MTFDISYDARELLQRACARRQIRLSDLVAETALWAHPETHRRQLRLGSAAVFPGIRRAKPGEERGVKNGQGLDDNSYANLTIKRALGIHRTKLIGFECCHIWPNTCYNARHHTVIANLVLLPRALAGLTDHDPQVQAALQYRSFELYRWHPEESTAPERPAGSPDQWRDPQPDPRAQMVSGPRPRACPSQASGGDQPVPLDKVRLWAMRPTSNVYRIVDIVNRVGSLSRHQLIREIERLRISRNAPGAVASLLTNAGNAYGRIFVEKAGLISIHPVRAAQVRQYWRPIAASGLTSDQQKE